MNLPSFDHVVEQLDWCNGPARAWGFGALSVSDVGASCALPGSLTRYRASSIDVAQRGATRTLGLQPVSFPKAPVQGRARPENDRDHAEVSVRPFKFRHVFEVHAVDASHRRRDRQDGCPRREATRDVGLLGLPSHLLRLAHHQACLKREGQDLAKGVDLLLYAPDVIRHVPEERLHVRLDREHLGVLELAADLDERHDRVAQAQQIAPKKIEALDLALGMSSRLST